MEVATQIPSKLEERLKLDTELRIPASWEEFLKVLPQCEYQVEYYGGEIISIMGQASEIHELIVATIIKLLGNMLDEKGYNVYGSNLPLYAESSQKNYYNADCTVVKGAAEKVEVLPGTPAVTNPALLVKVLSPSTQKEDSLTKLTHYLSIPSVQQVLLIDSSSMRVVSYIRQPAQDGWLLRNFTQASDECPVLEEGHFSLEALYRKISF
jgi:Uma2 family endonuclease